MSDCSLTMIHANDRGRGGLCVESKESLLFSFQTILDHLSYQNQRQTTYVTGFYKMASTIQCRRFFYYYFQQMLFSWVNYSEESLICRIRTKWIKRWECSIKVFSHSNYTSHFLIHTLLSGTVFRYQPLSLNCPSPGTNDSKAWDALPEMVENTWLCS